MPEIPDLSKRSGDYVIVDAPNTVALGQAVGHFLAQGFLPADFAILPGEHGVIGREPRFYQTLFRPNRGAEEAITMPAGAKPLALVP